jgi:hypothetical protein
MGHFKDSGKDEIGEPSVIKDVYDENDKPAAPFDPMWREKAKEKV